MDDTKTDMLNYWIEELLKYFDEIGFDVQPIPRIVLDRTPNDEGDLFIKTGYYDPTENKLVLFIDNRHIKDILRTFCHEMVHRNQNLVNPKQFAMSEGDMPLSQAPKLKKIESEAFLYGNLLFRQFTERYTHKDKLMNEGLVHNVVASQMAAHGSVHEEPEDEDDGILDIGENVTLVLKSGQGFNCTVKRHVEDNSYRLKLKQPVDEGLWDGIKNQAKKFGRIFKSEFKGDEEVEIIKQSGEKIDAKIYPMSYDPYKEEVGIYFD